MVTHDGIMMRKLCGLVSHNFRKKQKRGFHDCSSFVSKNHFCVTLNVWKGYIVQPHQFWYNYCLNIIIVLKNSASLFVKRKNIWTNIPNILLHNEKKGKGERKKNKRMKKEESGAKWWELVCLGNKVCRVKISLIFPFIAVLLSPLFFSPSLSISYSYLLLFCIFYIYFTWCSLNSFGLRRESDIIIRMLG